MPNEYQTTINPCTTESDVSGSSSTATTPPESSASAVESPLESNHLGVYLSPDIFITTDEETATMLEDVALGGLRSSRQSASPSPSLRSPLQSTRDLASDQIIPVMRDDHPLALGIGPAKNPLHKIISHLPSESQSRHLVDFYFKNVAWHARIFHLPSFLSCAQRLLDRIKSSPVPSEDFEVEFLPAYIMVLCLSYHLIAHDAPQSGGIVVQDADQMARKMYNLAYSCLLLQDYLAHHSLETVQCLILMCIYLQDTGDSHSQRALLGTAIKMAQNLGMSRLPSESEGRSYPKMWQSVVKREVARRVWWNLVFMDWSQASFSNGFYSIHPTQAHTCLPANLNDTELVEGKPIQHKPRDQYTEMTFSLTRFRFVEIHRQSIDLLTNPNSTTYASIISVDSKLRQEIDAIPTSFQMTGSMGSLLEKDTRSLEILSALVMGVTWRMRLHRPFLSRGYTDRRYDHSKEQCVLLAKAVISYLKAYPEHFDHLTRWRTLMSYTFGAIIVLFMDLCHQRQRENPSAEAKRRELEEALAVFRSGMKSTLSQESANLLERMISMSNSEDAKNVPTNSKAVQTAASKSTAQTESTKKRKSPDTDPDSCFERVAKRLLSSPEDLTVTPMVVHAPTASSACLEFSSDSMLSITPGGLFPYGLPTPPSSCKSVPPEPQETESPTLKYDSGWTFDTLFQRDPLLDTNVGWSSSDLQMMGFGMDNTGAHGSDGLPFGFDFGL
ncbi:hypothetical protein PM082_019355 [Marasmius tenuissimus]|nr:hypothetical protein PM082_019355 [Marasmius tenuissimus]